MPPSQEELLHCLLAHGIRTLCTVPCSITAAWQRGAEAAQRGGRLDLLTTSHEANLMGLAAGCWFADGQPALVHLQNSGLANAADGYIAMASPGVFAIPLAMVVTYRGATAADDSEPHQEIGRRTDALVQAIVAPSTVLAGDRLGQDPEPLLDGFSRVLRAARSGGQGLLKLSPLALGPSATGAAPPAEGGPMPPGWRSLAALEARKGNGSLPAALRSARHWSRDAAIAAILNAHPDAAVLFCNGYTARAARAIGDRKGNFYNVGYMGGTLAIGWALARRRPDREVVVVDGDQNAQMSAMKDHLLHHYPDNLHWYVLNNGVGASVGGALSLPLAPLYGALARVIPIAPDPPGPFPHPRVRADGSPTLAPLARRFRAWLAASSPTASPLPP